MKAAGIENGESCDAAARIELVERLEIVGEAWCVEVLRAAGRDESDRSVRKAIEAALVTLSKGRLSP